MLTNEDYYFNEQGLMVFTKAYHLKRGYCCGNKCRHCPYDYENVPDSINKEEDKAQNITCGNEKK